MAYEVMQYPNVPEERPGVVWAPKNGEIFIKSAIYDPESGPFSSDASAALDDEELNHIEEMVRDVGERIPKKMLEEVAELMARYLRKSGH